LIKLPVVKLVQI